VKNLIDEELARRSDRNDVLRSRQILEFAASEIVQGANGAELQRKLVNEGIDPSAAPSIIAAADSVVVEAKRRDINGRTLSGFLLFAVGIVITAATYTGAESTGGPYIVAWGAVVYGLMQFVRGIRELIRDRRASGRESHP
jgi:hypothetical protein